jgi:hypothetical protein
VTDTHRVLRAAAGAAAVLAVLVAGCSSSSGGNGANPPGKEELNRLQTIINNRPDLEVVKRQMIDLDDQTRAVIAKDAPETVLDPSTPKVGHGCGDPFAHNIGDSYATETSFGRPAPTDEQWQQISTELDPVFKTAGFRLDLPTNITTPLGSDPQTRDDGASITFVNRPGGNNVLDLSYTTGCHLPAAWRTAPPPPGLRPGNDPNVHYPYLYGPPGGRNAPAE